MDVSLRYLIHFKSITVLKRPFEEVLKEEPWRVYQILTSLLGEHNAELLLSMMSRWLRDRGCDMDMEELKRALSDSGEWTRGR
ncbi:MAG: hypothetical protein ABWJ97_03190 [Thermoproteus sp.]